jgi:3-isopropylmalate dehydrogenase
MGLNLAVIAGDGIGPEVVAEGLKVLDAVLPEVHSTAYDLGAAAYHRTGEALPDGVIDDLRRHHVNLRPVRLLPGVRSPLGDVVIDMVVVREGTEGPYVGNGGRFKAGTPHEVATEVSINTAYGVERVVRDAFRRAQARRGHLTLVHKTNVLVHAGGLWKRVTDEVARDFPDVTLDYQHVDAASMFFVTDPGRFDVVVTDNLFGDILTDIGAAIGGGIGLAASGNLDVSRTNPSMFEPVHGSAPDIAGQGKADPTATVLSVALLLEHLGYAAEARRVEAAVAADLLARGTGSRSTEQVGDAMVAALS